MSTTRTDRQRVLVLGRSQKVLDAVLWELAALGLAVEGSIRPDAAARDFDPAAFDLVAIGGGVDAGTRVAVKRAFADRNPEIRLLDAFAPVAVRQILATLDGSDGGPAIDLDRYFARIGHSGVAAPDLSTLQALLARHLAAIPFEAIDVLLDRPIDLQPQAVDAKLIGAGRGGYCFEQNSLLLRALATIGYRAHGHIGRVLWGLPAGSPPGARSHMMLRVEMDGVPWLVDVGFGSVVPTAPLRLDTEEPQETDHDTFRVFPYGTDLLLQVCRDGTWLPVYLMSREPVHDADYEAANWYTSTHPASAFRHDLAVARATPEARCALSGSRLTIRRPGREPERRQLDADGIEQALIGLFELPVQPDWRPVIEQAAAR